MVHSNTSHVIVYQMQLLRGARAQRFKYISCYCLSKQTDRKPFIGTNSNTSHVIVYLEYNDPESECPAFKYISCYCLSSKTSYTISKKTIIHIHLMLLFIGLWSTSFFLSTGIQIHLMLLFIR